MCVIQTTAWSRRPAAQPSWNGKRFQTFFDDVWWYSLLRVAITSKSRNLPTDRKSDGNGTRLMPLFLFFLFTFRRPARCPFSDSIFHPSLCAAQTWKMAATSQKLLILSLYPIFTAGPISWRRRITKVVGRFGLNCRIGKKKLNAICCPFDKRRNWLLLLRLLVSGGTFWRRVSVTSAADMSACWVSSV